MIRRIGFCALVTAGIVTTIIVRSRMDDTTTQPTHKNLRSTANGELELRRAPVRFQPRGDVDAPVSDEAALDVLDRTIPRWNPPTVPIMLHALRLWGRDAKFSVPEGVGAYSSDCSAFVEILLDNGKCTSLLGTLEEFLIDSEFGVSVVTSGDLFSPSINSEGHCDQLLKALGECGVGINQPLTTSSGRKATVKELITDSIARFTIEQELEFTAIAYSRWLPPEKAWINRFGDRFTFDDIADALIEKEIQ